MSDKIRLAVIFGGRSGEHEVSLMSAASILSVLDPHKYEVLQIGITTKGQWLTGEQVLPAFQEHLYEGLKPAVLLPQPGSNTLYALETGKLQPISQVDVVFPVLHGTFGEDGTLQGFLELADVAYVGAGVLGSAAGMDKGLFKHVMHANNIPVLEYAIFNRSDIQKDMAGVIRQCEVIADYPLFVKPANLGSSVGISKANNRAELVNSFEMAAAYDRRVIVERGISAREIEISVLGNEEPVASVPGEVIPKDIFYSYEDKYLNGVAELVIPAQLSEERSELMRALAVRAYKAIDCAGMARVDFFIDKNTDEIFLGELNTIPGFTQISMYPKLWQASGLPYAALVESLIALAFERKAERDKTEREFKA